MILWKRVGNRPFLDIIEQSDPDGDMHPIISTFFP